MTDVVPIRGVVEGPVDESEKSAMAEPFKFTTGGVFSLSVKLSAPLLLAVVEVEDELEDELVVAVGLKVTLIVQLFEGARVAGQLSFSAKAPEMVTFVMVRSAEPVLVSVTACGALVVPTSWSPKVKAVGENVATGAGVVPVPLRLTCCGLPAALSAIEIVAVSAAAVEGVNVMLMVHCDPPAASEPPQVLVWAKSVLLDVMPEMLKGALPTLVTVTVFAALAAPCP